MILSYFIYVPQVKDEAQLRKHSGRPSRPSTSTAWAAGPRGGETRGKTEHLLEVDEVENLGRLGDIYAYDEYLWFLIGGYLWWVFMELFGVWASLQ